MIRNAEHGFFDVFVGEWLAHIKLLFHGEGTALRDGSGV